MSLKSRTSWRQKLEKGEPEIVETPAKMLKTCGPGKMLIPRPLDVDALIRHIPESKLVTVTQIRESLAQTFKVDVTCPLTTGIFIRIAAEAAEEDLEQGKTAVTPYWRVLQANGRLNEKFPGGVKAQAERLEKEGHRIEWKGKAPRVVGFEAKLVSLNDE